MKKKNKTTIEDRIIGLLEENAIATNEDGGVRYEDFAQLRDSIIRFVEVNDNKWKKRMKRLQLECRVNICECGRKWKDTDMMDLINDYLNEIVMGI